MQSFRRQSHRQYRFIASGLWTFAFVCCTLPTLGQKAKKPNIQAASAIAIDAQTGAVLFAKSPDNPLPPASTTKIVTGLLLAKHPKPNDPVPISLTASQTPGSHVGLQTGQAVKAHNLLNAVLLVSANDASTAAAEFLDGSVPAFVERMNAEAQAANAPNTHFQNPHGLQDLQHLSTARDLANLARAAMQNPEFAAAVAQPSAQFPRPNAPAQTLVNTNTLLGSYPGMDGIKTGWTPEAGYCFVGSATRNGRRIITVVLNSPNWQSETRALLDYGFAQKREQRDTAIMGATRSSEENKFKPKRAAEYGTDKQGFEQEKLSETTEKTGYTRQPSGFSRHYGAPDRIAATLPNTTWLWWILLLALLISMLWLGRKRMASLFENWAFLRRKNREQTTTPSPASKKKLATKQKVGGDLVFVSPKLPRRSAANWLSHILDNPNRLLEPAVRRHAQAVIASQKRPELGKLTELLSSSQAKIRFAASEILLPFLPRRAEETLLAIAQDEKVHAETRAEAVAALARNGSDRHEMTWLQMLLKDGSLSAANALARLPILEDKTEQALQRILNTPQAVKQGSEQEMKLKTLSAASASVLAIHGKIEPADADEFIGNLPDAQREQTLSALTRHAETEWTIKNWLDMALAGKGHAVLPSLLEADPAIVRKYLDAVPEDDPVVRTSAKTLRWFLLNEGEPEMVKKAAATGDTLAMGAVALDRLHRWNPNHAAPDVLLASLHIVSARLGYTAHSNEQITSAFRKTTDAESTEDIRDLKPLTDAYAHPAVHDAVQTVLYTETGLSQILVALSQETENETYAAECAFWQDKAPDNSRLTLTQNLRTDSPSELSKIVQEMQTEALPEVEPVALDHAA